MKTCTACEEQFEDKFSFCPVDGTPLNSLAAAVSGYSPPYTSSGIPQASPLLRLSSQERPYGYRPTILSSSGLLERLAVELRFLVDRLRQAWPELKHDPLGFAKDAGVDVANLLRQRLGAQGVLSALTALLLVFSFVLFVVRQGAASPEYPAGNDEKSSVEILTLPNASHIPSDSGVGTGPEGRVGLDVGKGEGSQPTPKRAQGGGSSGDHHELVAQQGRLPQPAEIPARIPSLPPARNPALPVAGIDIDPALWKNLPFPVYGDPRSKSATPSNGPGDGGGIGDDKGTGIGEGRGDGFGPGSDGNMGGDRRQFGPGGPGGGTGNDPYDPDRVLPVSKVEQRVRILAKPEPQYTEEARRSGVTGTVVLRVVFSKSGEVTNIRTILSLPLGLTEKAIAAARQIRFAPATTNGRPVSVYMQLEYNFNLY